MTTLAQRKTVKQRIRSLPTAVHNCQTYGIWVRRPTVTGKLVCVVCGKP
jgi:hypothetical protein